MKRVIKLTESDLQIIVKKVLRETKKNTKRKGLVSEQPALGNYLDALGAGTGWDFGPGSVNYEKDCLEYNSGKNKMSLLLTYVSKLPTGQITPQVQKWNDRLYKSMKGLGTSSDYINVLKELKTPQDLAMIYKSFKYEGENLWDWMSGEYSYSWDDTFNAIPPSVRNPAKIPLCSKENPNKYGPMLEQYFNNIGTKTKTPVAAEKAFSKIYNIEDVPKKAQSVTNQVVQSLSPSELKNIRDVLASHDITSKSNLGDIKDKVEDIQQDVGITTEMTEDDENLTTKEKFWKQATEVLGFMGFTNLVLFGAPFSVLYTLLSDSGFFSQGSMQVSGLISTLLIMLAGAEERYREKRHPKKKDE